MIVKNALLEIIKKEDNEDELEKLIDNYKMSKNIDYISSGYIVELFKIFHNDYNFCIKEKKTIKCILYGKNESEDIADHSCFFTIIPEDLNEKKLFNIFKKYKEKYSYYSSCKNNNLENYQSTTIIYNLIDYPQFLFLLIDTGYNELNKYQDKILNLIEEVLILGFNIQ